MKRKQSNCAVIPWGVVVQAKCTASRHVYLSLSNWYLHALANMGRADKATKPHIYMVCAYMDVSILCPNTWAATDGLWIYTRTFPVYKDKRPKQPNTFYSNIMREKHVRLTQGPRTNGLFPAAHQGYVCLQPNLVHHISNICMFICLYIYIYIIWSTDPNDKAVCLFGAKWMLFAWHAIK